MLVCTVVSNGCCCAPLSYSTTACPNLRTSAICNSFAAAWMACGGIRPVGPRGAALAAAGARLPFLLADGGMEAVVAMEPRLALLAVAARAAPLPPPFFIACVLLLPAVWGA